MFLKKKEKDPNWTAKQTWEWELKGAQNRPALNLTSKNYIGGMDSHIIIQDPSRHATIRPAHTFDTTEKNIQHERRRQQVLSEIQRDNEKGLRGALKGLGDKLFGKW